MVSFQNGTGWAKRIAVGAACAVLLLTLTPGSNGVASQATPTAPTVATACTVLPRPLEEMRSLLVAGLPEIEAFPAGTPTIAAATPTPPPSIDGVPADAAAIAAATDIVEQFVACSNAGDLPAVAALLTDRGAQGFLGFGYLAFREILPGDATASPSGPDGVPIDLYFGAIQLRAPLPAASRLTLHGIDDVRVLPGGDIEVVLLLATGSGEPRATALVLRQERGSYRIVFGPDGDDGGDATPVP